jgi:hypothetical protein
MRMVVKDDPCSIEIGTAQIEAALRTFQFAAALAKFRGAVGAILRGIALG